ncbi:glycosyltransferase [Sphingobacterium anhuiense]|uniref:Glycosyltransferase n=1 Tax=Sphingobacterium anhuiense TaxID=493780 RepID=A0ABW5Z0C0_9SPHI
MKNILLISTGDSGGAYEAMYKLSQILIASGQYVKMLVKHKTKDDSFIVPYRYPENVWHSLDRVFNKIGKHLNFKHDKFSTAATDPKYSFISLNESEVNLDCVEVLKQIEFEPDFIFTGMTNNFCNSTDYYNLVRATGAQLYNVTVDMNHFTGGCHFAWDCMGYITGCDTQCPAIIDKQFADQAQKNFEVKFKNAKAGNFKILSGSGHTLNQARLSKIYKNQSEIENINSLIDTELLNPKNREHSKFIFDFDPDKFYILTGAQNMNDPRKGFCYLLESLQILSQTLPFEIKERIVIVVVAKKKTSDFDKIDFEKVYLDYIKDYRLLAQLYKSVDLFVNTSVEDSGPMMVSEALACGTPVVGFDTGILINMIENGNNGYKVEVKDSDGLAQAIKTIVSLSEAEYQRMSQNAVLQVQRYSSFDYASFVLEKILKGKN